MANLPYIVDGIMKAPSGETSRWTGWQIESRADIYTVRAYEYGGTVYLHNYRPLTSLPTRH